MFPRTLTRFHLVVASTVLLGGLALWLRSGLLFGAIVAAFVFAIALGVTIPSLRFFGPYVCRAAAAGRRVALTFDDGPDPQSTPRLLDLLRETNAKAAFFCVGRRVADHPDLAARIMREGHLIGNHSYSHDNATNFFTVARLKDELTKAQTAIEKATGTTPTCFRPPMGLSNPRVFDAARALGLKVIGWTVRGLDTRLKEPDRIVARILQKVRPGAIILLHDGNIPAERLVSTVKTLLDALHGLGYEVVRLDTALE